MDPNIATPKVYDYLWLYWILKQRGLIKDIIHLIIGSNKKLLLKFGGLNLSKRVIIVMDCSKENASLSEFNIEYYFLWDRKPPNSFLNHF
jgi:hypothetical protein